MRYLTCTIVFAVATLGMSLSTFADDKIENQIKKAIVVDSAMMEEDFVKIFEDHSIAGIQDHSLTYFLLTLDVSSTSERERAQFDFTCQLTPEPSEITKELRRQRRTGRRAILLDPVTFVHLDRITQFTCEQDGNAAKGNVAFEVPGLCKGHFQYLARKRGDEWFVEEFLLSEYGVRLVRSESGFWSRK